MSIMCMEGCDWDQKDNYKMMASQYARCLRYGSSLITATYFYVRRVLRSAQVFITDFFEAARQVP